MDTAFPASSMPCRHAHWHSQRPTPTVGRLTHTHTHPSPASHLDERGDSDLGASVNNSPHRGKWHNWHQAPPSSPPLFTPHPAHQPHPLDPHMLHHHASSIIAAWISPQPPLQPHSPSQCPTGVPVAQHIPHTHAVSCMRGRESVTAPGWQRGVSTLPKHLRHLRQNRK